MAVSRFLSRLALGVGLAVSALLPARAQLKWSAYNDSGVLVGTQGQAATFDAATATYTFVVPAGAKYTFITQNFVPLTMSAPGTGTTIQTITYTQNASAGWTNATTGNRINQLGLFSDGGTAPAATGNFLDDNGLFGNLKGGSWGNEVFGGTTTMAGLLGGYQSGIKLGSGKAAGTTTAWTLVDGHPVNITLRIALTSGGSFSLGTASAYASAGIVCEDATTVGDGTSYQTIYSGAAASVTAPKTFNEFAFYFRNDAATDSTITISNFAGLVAPPYFAAVSGQPPASLTGSIGDTLTISVNTVGSSVAYQWEKSTDGGQNFTAIDAGANATATTASLVLASVDASAAGQYRVVISNGAGSSTSTACTVDVTSGAVAPTIQTPPQSATILVGGSNTFTVAASGTSPLSYRWQKSTNGGGQWTDIDGATGSTYTLANAQLSDDALYRVVITNSVDTATSAAADLTVNEGPAITGQPAGATLQPGDNLTLTVTATGTPAPTYQWNKNGVAIDGATAASYTLTGVTGASTANYTVTVTNVAGSVTSSPASVAVVASDFAITAATPVNGGSGANPDTRLTLTFNRAVTPGVSGLLQICDASNDAVVDTIDLLAASTLRTSLGGTSSLSLLNLPVQNKTIGGVTNFNYYPLTVAGSTVTIYPRNGVLAYGKTYYVKIGAGAFVDASGGAFAGIADSTTWRFSTKASGPSVGATLLTVAADGSGDFDTVQGALDFVPAANTTPTTIRIKNGTYFEQVVFSAKNNLTIVGEDRTQTAIVYPNNNTFNNVSGFYHRSTVIASSVHDVTFANLKVSNSTPQGGTQAEALIVSGSSPTTAQNIITNCSLYSFQDTLQVNKQCYVSDCYIEGDVDFMWGDGPVFLENCDIHMRLRSGTAGYFSQIRNPATNHGYVFSHCRFTADAGQTGTALGRIDPNVGQFPYSEVVLMNCVFGDAANNGFLNTTVGSASGGFFGGWWLLNGVSTDVSATIAANVHYWDYNTKDYLDATPVFNSTGTRPAFTIMPTDGTTIANYGNATWVLGTTIAGTVNATWTPALAPVIAAGPQSLTVTAGQSATFTVAVSAIPAATYQWQKDGADIDGATAASYTIASAADTDAASYSVIVTNTGGSVPSSAAVLTVNPAPAAPAITTQPQSQSAHVGDHVTLTVIASGDAPLGYQWKKDGEDVIDATAATLDFASVQLADAGSYTVVVSNSVDSITSAAATLTVQPAVVTPDAPVATAATAVGSTGFTANWNASTGATGYRLDVATGNTFSAFVSGYQDLDVGANLTKAVTGLSAGTYYYRVRATNTAGTSASSNTITAVIAAPATGISIAATGTTGGATYVLGGAAYTQNFDTLPSSGTFTWANSSTLAGWYAAPTTGSFDPAGVIVDGSANMVDLKIGSVGAASSSERALAYHTKLNTAPTYLGLAFTNDSGRDLDSFTLSYTAEQWREVSTSSRNLSFTVQYRIGATAADLNATTGWTTVSGLDFTSLNGSAGATATLTATAVPITLPPGSTIWFRWITANTATSSTNSNDIIAIDNVSVSLTAVPDGSPVITTQPQSQTVDVGTDAVFTVAASGDTPFTYQWSKDGSELTGQTAATLTVPSAQAGDAGDYTVVVTNGKGSATSLAATLTISTVVHAPLITTQPQSQTVDTGATVVFTVAASGTAPLSYEWRKNNTTIPNEISDTLTLNNVQPSDAGAYTVIVSNSAGSDTSAAASLDLTGVVTPPVILAQSGSQSVVIGGAVSFSVTAGGSAPFSYQWRKDNVDIDGATAPTLTLTNVQLTAAGNYTVIVTNDASSVTSEPVTLTVNEPPAVGEGSLFAAPDGLVDNPGTFAQPTTLAHAITLVPAGGTIYVRGGTYAMSTELRIERGNNGADGQLKNLIAYVPAGGVAEKPVFDFSSQPYTDPSNGTNFRGIWLGGDYWHLKGLEIKYAADNGVYVVGNHNIVELCVMHHNHDTGLQIGRYSSSAPRSEWPTYNLILNCESYDNDDVAPGTGENADGFACKLTAGAGNVFRGCISHNNIDDGWDLYTKSATGPIDPVVIDQCISYSNGTLTDGTQNPAGDKNGFKLGGEQIAVAHYVSRCISFNNGKNGFTWNSNPGAIVLVNNLAWDNTDGNYKFDSGEATFYNNVSLWTTSSGPGNRNGVNDRYVGNSGIPTGASNIFWFVGSSSRGPSINDNGLSAYKTAFVTLTVPDGGFTRNADGSIALGDFARPVANSPLINAGVLPPNDVIDQFPFATSGYYEDAPDLGAVETYLHTPPTITSAPTGQSVLTGASFTLAVSVQGTTPFTFQWSKDGSPIDGATASTYSVATATTADSGSYTVAITNSVTTVTSDPAVVTVAAPTAPTITTQPQSQTVNVGTPVTFTVAASGTAPFTYQWSKDASPIDGATGASYTIAAVQTTDAGAYTVRVTNSLGHADSDIASLTVDTTAIAPTITTQPAGATKIVGSSYTFTVAATGSQPFTYQWKKDGHALDGATSASLALADIAGGDAGSYTVVVANDGGSIESSAAVLTVTAAPDTVYLSDTFADGSRGGQSLPNSAAWWTSSGASNFTATTGAATQVVSSARTIIAYFTNSAATPVTLGLNQKLTLECVVQFTGFDSAAGTSVSNFRVGLLRSPDDSKRFATDFGSGQPATHEFADYTGYAALSVANNAGDPVPVSFGVRDQSNDGLVNTTLAYTALDNGTPAASSAMATGTDYRVTLVVTRTSGGNVLYYKIARASDDAVVMEHTVTDAATTYTAFDTVGLYFGKNGSSATYSAILKSATVALANLAVPSAPSITTQPQSQTVGSGSNVTLTVVATGTAPFTYQWKKDNVAIDGATAATLTLNNVQAGDAASYTVTVTNDLGFADSSAAVLTVTQAVAPSITAQPQSQSATVGDSVTLSVTATGTDPLSYVWKKDGAPVDGATASSLTFASVQLADAGSYTVTVTNSADSVTSDAVVLSVSEPPPVAPTITTQPQSQTVTLNGTATFTVVATGTAPLSYQWKKDGAPIDGATGTSLTLTNVQTADAAGYTVTVTNNVSSVTSDSATLSISSSLPVTEFNLTGFATVGTGTTGGGEIPDTDAAYRKVTTPLELVQAITDSNKTAGKVKVIEIMNDLNLGWNEVGATVQGLASNPLRSHATPKLHPVLIQTGVSLLDIKAKSPLTIFSANGATIKHCTFNVKGTSNIIIRNLKFDEMWEWDESSKGNYDSNDWDFIDIANGGDVSNVWIDHCTFTKAYDGIVDIKAGGTNVTISWCTYLGDDGATNPNSFVRQQLAWLEANKSSTSFYKYLRDTAGYTVDEIATIIQGHDKTHLMGANSLKTENDTLTATFHHLWMKNVWDRAVPRLRGGNVHDYNIYVDDTEALAARRMRDAKAALLTTAQQNTLNNTYSFRPPLNGAISTEGGSVLVEKSIYKDCLWPLRNNQTDPSNAVYTGKIKALDSIYSFLNTDNSTTVVRGDSTDAGNPMGPFQATIIPFAWDLTGGVLPYTYTVDDPAQLPSILEAGAGAGTLTWAPENWLKTTYVADASVAPSITAQPQAQTVATGADATFTVQATGSGTLAYQWKKNGSPLSDGVNIAGATTSVLTIASATTDDAGTYSVLVSNNAGSAASNGAALTVVSATAPTIATQPQSQSGPAGSQLQLKVVAAGTGPFSYQWKRNGSDIVGATGDTLDFLSLTTDDAGTYTVVVTNTGGTVTSSAATVSVGTTPAAPVASAATAVTAGGFTANWSTVSGVTGYRLDVSTDSAFGTFVSGYQDLDVGAVLTSDVTGLAADTTYYFRVRAVNDLGTSLSSNVVPVTTAPADGGSSSTTILHETFPNATATYGASPNVDGVNGGLVTDTNGFPTPTSTQAAWASFGSANVPYVQNTSIGISTGNKGLIAYFEPSTSVASLAVGETLTATITFSFAGGTAVETAGNFRIALLNSGGNGTATNVGGAARFASAVSNSLTSSSAVQSRGYFGYIADLWASQSTRTDAISFWRRVAAADSASGSTQIAGPTVNNGDLAATSTFIQVGATGGGSVGAMPNDGTAFTGTLSVTRTSATQVDLSWTVMNGATTVMSYAVSQTSGDLVTSFDSLVIFNNSGPAITIGGLDIAKSSSAAAVAPVITVQPTSQTVIAGDSATLSVAASGTAPLSYQWKKGGSAISGATAATYTIAAPQESDSGSYTVTVSNSAGSVTSSAAVLTVDTPPAITSQPTSQSLVAGSTATFTVVASGTAPLSYQWKKDDVDLSGATSATLTLNTIQAADSGDYTVVVTNAVGTATSDIATLTVTQAAQAPVITTQPLSQSVTLGDNATFTVGATGTAPLSYVWKKDGAPISGATAATLSLTNVQPADAGSYTVTVTNTVDSATSSAATLTVAIPAPVIAVQPVAQSALLGSRVNFSVAATGYGLSYQWAKNGTPLAGATGSLLQLSGLVAGDAANYTVTVTNDGGSLTSSAAALTLVEPAVTLPTQPTIPAGVFKVTDYGAIGDGTTDNTAAIQAAINAAQTAGGGTIEIPAASGAYLSSSLTLRSNMNLQIDAGATLQAQAYNTYANANAHFITIASGSTNVALTGAGVVEGNGSAWWTAYNSNSSVARPRLVQFSHASNVLVSGLTFRNGPMFHVAVATTNNATIYGLTISAPSSSPNTDGIDPSGSNFLIQGCNISVGDDNIAVKASDLCSNINVADCAFGAGHGLSVGGQSNAGLNGMNVMRCTFNGTSVGLRLKADATQGGPVQNLTYSDLTMTNVPYPIVFYSYYNQLGSPGATSGSSQTTPSEVVSLNAAPPNPLNVSTIPTWKNITVRNLTATGASGYSILWGIALNGALIDNVVFDNVKVTGGAGLELYNASNVQLVNGTSFGGTTLTANALGITGQPQDAAVDAGGNATFTVTAVGKSGVNNTAPTFQWKRNGTALTDGTQASGAVVAGATTASLSLTNVAAADAGQYTCTVANNLDGYNTSTSTVAPDTLPVSATSAIATLTVNGSALQAPEIITAPASQSINEGGTVTFTVDAFSTVTPTYQWKHDGNAIDGATAASLTLTGVTGADAGDYTVTVTNDAGSVTSAPATLTVHVTPATAVSIAHDAFAAGDKNAGLSTDTNGFLAPTDSQVVWFGGGATPTYTSGTAIKMSASSSTTNGRGLLAYFVPSTSVVSLDVGEAIVGRVVFNFSSGTGASSAGNFRMAFLNSGGNGGPTNDGASASPRPDAEAIPAARIAIDAFSLTAGGNTPRGYSGYVVDTTAATTASTDSLSFWRRDGGQGKSQQWTGPTSSDMAASGTFSQVVAPGGGSAGAIAGDGTSYVATYTIERVSATETMLSYTVTSGNGATTVMSHSGTETSATPITGFDTFFIMSMYPASLSVTDFSVAKIAAPPVIMTQPADQSTAEGADVSFTVAVSGTTPLTYVWKKDGTALVNGGHIAGADTATLALTGVTSADAGSYTVEVTNSLDSVTSSAAVLTVSSTPVQPTVTWSDPAPIAYGTALGDTQLNATAGVDGAFAYTPAAGTVLEPGADQTLSVTFTPTDSAHYLPVTQTVKLTVNKADATVVLGGLAATYDGSAHAATATTTPSGLTVAFTYDTSATAPTDAGSYAVVATVNDTHYAGTASGTLVIAPATQTVTFGTLPATINVGVPFTVSATASSGLTPVTFSVVSGNATISGASVTATDTSPVTIRATQAGDGNRAAATADATFSATQRTQTITFAALSDVFTTNGPIALGATASSNLAVTYTLVSGPATLSGATLTLTGDTGTVTVRASQAGNAAYAAATDVDRSFAVSKQNQTITFAALSDVFTTQAPITLGATASSNLAVTYTLVSGPATLSGSTLTLTGDTGTVTVRASQAGNGAYNAAVNVDRSFAVTKQSQTITFAAIADHKITDGPITLSATASSNLAVTFALVSGPATLNGVTLTLSGQAGTVVVRASQAGNAAYAAAADVDRSFAVTDHVAPAITTQPVAKQTVTAGASVTFAVTATGYPVPTYQWMKNGTAVTGATAATLTIDNVKSTDAATYTVVVTNDAGTVTSSGAALIVNVPDFAGIYFGTFSSGGTWALNVNADRTGTYIAYLPDRGSAIVLSLIVEENGTFSVTGSEIRPLTSPVARAALKAASASSSTPKASALTGGFTLTGSISGNGITGALDGLGVTFTGTQDSPTGGSSSLAGIYTATSSGTAGGATYVIIGASGRAVVVTSTSTVVTGGSGTLDSGGQLSITAADSSTIQLNVNSQSQEIGASVTPAGSSLPITFTGSAGSADLPHITSGGATTFTIGVSSSFTVTATGLPAPTFATDLATDSPVKIDAKTGVLSAKLDATKVAVGDLKFTITADNGNAPAATQAFTLHMAAAPTATTPLTVATVAGKAGSVGSADGLSVAAKFNYPMAAAVDAAGVIYVADTYNHELRKIDVDGRVTTFAGLAGNPAADDGTGSNASFNSPSGIVADSSGNLYVADTLNHTIRKVTPEAKVTTIAGQAGVAGSVDDDTSADVPAGAGLLNAPQGLALDGTDLYVADTNNHTIRRVDLTTGKISTVAGLAGHSGSADGTASLARFNAPSGVAVDSSGNLYVADTDNHTIRVIAPNGDVGTLAGLAGASGAADGTAGDARFAHPAAIAVHGSAVYVADTDNGTIRKVTFAGKVTTIAGLATADGSKGTDGSGSTAVFRGPAGLTVTDAGEFYIADTNNCTIRLGVFPNAPVITGQPQSATVSVGGSTTFTVVATGQPAPTYQWYLGDTAIKGATSASFTVQDAQSYNAGDYTVVVTNDEGSATSEKATLTVNGTDTSGGGSSGGGGGGGAPSTWFCLALAVLAAARWTTRRRSSAHS